jgi:xanthosine utilization system XapX-like protein
MHYTKIALLTFGAGLVLGLIVVVAEIDALARLASGLMALGIVGIPFGMVFDWRRATRADRAPTSRTPTKGAAKPSIRRRAAVSPRRAPRSRRPAAPKR